MRARWERAVDVLMDVMFGLCVLLIIGLLGIIGYALVTGALWGGHDTNPCTYRTGAKVTHTHYLNGVLRDEDGFVYLACREGREILDPA